MGVRILNKRHSKTGKGETIETHPPIHVSTRLDSIASYYYYYNYYYYSRFPLFSVAIK